jgi:hypothetical protein
MLTILVRMKILTDALASVASVWIRAWFTPLRYDTSGIVRPRPPKRRGPVQPVDTLCLN